MDDVSSTSRIDRSPDERSSRTWRPERCDRVALVLQGGGALGAYQAGVCQAMHEAGLEPDWVSGVSIGAINDTRRTLKHQKRPVMPPPGSGILVHDVHRETD